MPDLVSRRFAPGAPDVCWCGDITYVRTGEGWLYVAWVIDLGSRRLIGYAMADHMRTELVAGALKMAADTRGRCTAGIIFHGDRGAQYMSGDYRKLVIKLGMIQSVGRTDLRDYSQADYDHACGVLNAQPRRQYGLQSAGERYAGALACADR